MSLCLCAETVQTWTEVLEVEGHTEHMVEVAGVAFDHLVRVEVGVDFVAEGNQ